MVNMLLVTAINEEDLEYTHGAIISMTHSAGYENSLFEGADFIDNISGECDNYLDRHRSEKIRAGWAFAAIKDHIEKLVNEVRVFFMVDNLDYLVRGGRIGRGSAMFGKLFGFKPILDMVGGGVNAKGRTIGGRRAQQKMIEFMRQEIGDSNKPLKVGICHASAPKKAEKIKQLVEGSFPNHDHVVSYFGPIVGAHTGPGAVGVAYLALPED